MVGSVLMDRLRADDDFSGIESVFFSTSQVGQEAPTDATETQLQDAMSITALSGCDVIVTCQGGDYTKDNSEVKDVYVHYSLLGQVAKQTKDLPDGTKVNIDIED